MLSEITHPIMVKDMSDAEFVRLGDFIQQQCGIKMPLSKKTMLQSRLSRRLRLLRMVSYADYAEYLKSPKGNEAEIQHMIDAVTTNKTDFFREPHHFDFLSRQVLADTVHDGVRLPARHMKFWSAGCATGEEPYTLAMVLAEHALIHPDFHFSVLATDISTKVLQEAREAVYPLERIDPIPMPLRKKYLLKSKDKPLIKICSELRFAVQFMRLNFMDEQYAFRDTLDAVFCRNVMIYFDRRTQEKILERICRHLAPGGYLFIGHSESLSGMNLPLQLIESTIYRKCHDQV